MQQHLFNHSGISGHCSFLKDVSLTFIDQTDPSDLLKREDYYRSTLKTMAPFGLSIEESVQQNYYQCLEHLCFDRAGTF